MHLHHHQLPSKTYYLDRLGNMSTNTSSSSTMSTSSGGSTSSASSTSSVGGGGGAATTANVVRKQILPLKPKQMNSYVQHLDMKCKDVPNVPVTMLELKKKDKVDKNVVTTLTYRKPSTVSSGGSLSSDHHHHHHHHNQHRHHHPSTMLVNGGQQQAGRRSGSPSSSGYDTDSLVDQENCDVFSNLLSSAFTYGHPLGLHEQLDMLHSHPIWSPQPTLNNNSLLMSNVHHHHHHQHHHNNNNNNNALLNQNELINSSSHQYLYFADSSDKFLVQ